MISPKKLKASTKGSQELDPLKTDAQKANSKPRVLDPKLQKKLQTGLGEKSRPAPVKETLELLRRYYPDAHCALVHRNPFELLVATVLSAQCTDERVNKVTPPLFARFPDPAAMAAAELPELEELIRSAGFYKNKAKNLKSLAESLTNRHGGEVPQKLEELVQLAGVGRKTANVVMGNAFAVATGVVVDTHVGRLSFRLGWTTSHNPVQIERDLAGKIPEDRWIQLSHELIFHGRQICLARKPRCSRCFLSEICPKRGVTISG